MSKSIFEYQDYKAYLIELIQDRPRGEKSRIAEALRCHIAYISQVLNDAAQLSLEQADLLSAYLTLSEDEAEYLFLLVSQARAGSASLRKHFEKKIKQTLQARATIENRIKSMKILPHESQAIYYSAWHYSAIHLLLSIPEFQTKEKMAAHLRLPVSKITKALDFLVESGLAVFEKGRYSTGQVTLHLQNESPWIARHHVSWRLQAVRALEEASGGFHYTSVVSMAEEDGPAVRRIMVDAIEQIRAVVKQSPEKGAYCYALDFFGV